MNSFINWSLHYYGSTRSSALIRIGLVFLAWSRWASELVLFKSLNNQSLAISIIFFVASTLMLVGYKTRFSTLATGAILTILYTFYGIHHHTYLLAFLTFLSALTPAGKSYSVDRWLEVKQNTLNHLPNPLEHGNLFGLRLMQIQLCVLYFWAAYDKSSSIWVSGVRMEQYFVWFYSAPSFPEWAYFSLLMSVLAWTVLILEYALAFGLFIPRFWALLIPLGIALHIAFYVFLPVSTFSLTCILMYLAILNADDIHKATET